MHVVSDHLYAIHAIPTCTNTVYVCGIHYHACMYVIYCPVHVCGIRYCTCMLYTVLYMCVAYNIVHVIVVSRLGVLQQIKC